MKTETRLEKILSAAHTLGIRHASDTDTYETNWGGEFIYTRRNGCVEKKRTNMMREGLDSWDNMKVDGLHTLIQESGITGEPLSFAEEELAKDAYMDPFIALFENWNDCDDFGFDE